MIFVLFLSWIGFAVASSSLEENKNGLPSNDQLITIDLPYGNSEYENLEAALVMSEQFVGNITNIQHVESKEGKIITGEIQPSKRNIKVRRLNATGSNTENVFLISVQLPHQNNYKVPDNIKIIPWQKPKVENILYDSFLIKQLRPTCSQTNFFHKTPKEITNLLALQKKFNIFNLNFNYMHWMFPLGFYKIPRYPAIQQKNEEYSFGSLSQDSSSVISTDIDSPVKPKQDGDYYFSLMRFSQGTSVLNKILYYKKYKNIKYEHQFETNRELANDYLKIFYELAISYFNMHKIITSNRIKRSINLIKPADISTICHNDFHLGNIMFNDQKNYYSVIDTEGANPNDHATLDKLIEYDLLWLLMHLYRSLSNNKDLNKKRFVPIEMVDKWQKEHPNESEKSLNIYLNENAVSVPAVNIEEFIINSINAFIAGAQDAFKVKRDQIIPFFQIAIQNLSDNYEQLQNDKKLTEEQNKSMVYYQLKEFISDDRDNSSTLSSTFINTLKKVVG